MSKWRYLAILLVSAVTMSCSHMLYYPQKDQLLDPSRAGLIPENVWLKHTDGTRIHGWYFKHPSSSPSRALMIFFHGNGENLTSHFASMIWILDHAYDFVIFDYQGYGQSDGSPSPEKTVQDGKLFLQWASEKARAQKIPLFVFGQSLGGAVAMRTVIEMKDQILLKAVVIDASFMSYRHAGQKTLSNHWFTWPFQWLSYLLLSDAWAPGDRVAEISPVPLLVIHGTADSHVSFELGEKIFEYAREPKEFLKIEGGKHLDVFWRERGKYREPFLKFVEKNLK